MESPGSDPSKISSGSAREAFASALSLASVRLYEIPDYGNSERLHDAAVQAADLSRPVLLAEIAPARFSLIDRHHRGEGATNVSV
jgi:hypothetical protein